MRPENRLAVQRRGRKMKKRGSPSRNRTNGRGVAGTERGVRGQRRGALRSGQRGSGGRAGVGHLLRAERPHLSEKKGTHMTALQT